MHSAAYLALFAAAAGTALAQNPSNFDADTAPRAYSEETYTTVTDAVSQIGDGQIQAPYYAEATATTTAVDVTSAAAIAEETTAITLTADVPASVSSAMAELASIVSAASSDTQIFSILPVTNVSILPVETVTTSLPAETTVVASPTGSYANTTVAVPTSAVATTPVLVTPQPSTLSVSSRGPLTITSTAVEGGTATTRVGTSAGSATTASPTVQTDNAAAAVVGGGMGVVGWLALVAGGFLLA